MAPLQRAVALKQVHGVFSVAKDLNFDVARLLDVFLDQDIRVAKGGLCLASRTGEGIGEIARLLDQAHAFAAATRNRLDQDGITDVPGGTRQTVIALIRTVIARHDRHAGLFHQRLGGVFQTHGADRSGRGADESQARRLDRVDEIGIFGEEAVARMNRLGACLLGGGYDGILAQITVGGGRSADMHRLVRHGDVTRGGIGIGIDRDGAHAERTGAFDDAAGNFATIGNQDLFKHHFTYLACGARCPLRLSPGDRVEIRGPSQRRHPPQECAPGSVAIRKTGDPAAGQSSAITCGRRQSGSPRSGRSGWPTGSAPALRGFCGDQGFHRPTTEPTHKADATALRTFR